jgi:hypothetical protein
MAAVDLTDAGDVGCVIDEERGQRSQRQIRATLFASVWSLTSTG